MGALRHYGVKGMRWGVRNYKKGMSKAGIKPGKKDVKLLKRQLKRKTIADKYDQFAVDSAGGVYLQKRKYAKKRRAGKLDPSSQKGVKKLTPKELDKLSDEIDLGMKYSEIKTRNPSVVSQNLVASMSEYREYGTVDRLNNHAAVVQIKAHHEKEYAKMVEGYMNRSDILTKNKAR